jgi:hypothetical protein
MLTYAIAFFLVAAMIGLFVLLKIFKNKAVPTPVILTHGGIAAIGILLLLITVLRGNTAPLLLTSLILFIVAALGGATMVALARAGKPVPNNTVIFHPILAVCALLLLLAYVIF